METTKGYHLGDPCYFCGKPHDEVPVGPCPAASAVDEKTMETMVEFEDANRELWGWDGYHVEDVRNMAWTFLTALRSLAAPDPDKE